MNKLLLIVIRLTFCLLLFLSPIWAHAQVIPPSPVSYSFSKYIDQEVSLYNGIPEISIPLYNIKLNGLSIPISLSYHASGIKYRQDNGDVGVGWVLNPGNRVSRTIYGYEDESFPMASGVSDSLYNYDINATTLGGKEARDKYLSKFDYWGEFDPPNGERYDGEFDQFTFSTSNSGGEFIISDRINKTVSTTEDSNLKIDYNVGSFPNFQFPAILGFLITDDSGIKYSYGSYYPQQQDVIECATDGAHPTAWGLKNIITPLGDEVNFNYTFATTGGWKSQIRTQMIHETFPSSPSSDETQHTETGGVNDLYQAFFASEINTPNEKIIFNRSNGNLNNIQILTTSGNPIKSIEFYYSFNNYHKFLDSLIIFDKNHVKKETFKLDYYSKQSTEEFIADQYGYYKPGNTLNVYHQEFSSDPVILSPNGANQPMSYFIGNGVSRESSLVPDYFSLEKITYPTGGYTEYNYEAGSYSELGLIKNAGIRIKNITSSDLNKQEAIVKNYKYGITDEEGYGVAELLVNHTFFVDEKVHMTELWAGRTIFYSTAMQGDVGHVLDKYGFVKYPSVTEYYSNSDQSGNGKTQYSFNIGNLFDASPLANRNEIPNGQYRDTGQSFYQGAPLFVNNYRLWDKPCLSMKMTYSYKMGQYALVKSEEFEYEQLSRSFKGIKVKRVADRYPSSAPVHSYVNYFAQWDAYLLNSFYNYGEYSFEVGRNVLKRKLEYDYVNGNAIVNDHTYDYSNFLLSKETVMRSTGDKYVSYTTYPLDYALGTSFIDDMKSNGLIGYPIEKINYLDDGSNQRILFGTINQYKTGGKGLIDSQWNLESSSPINLNSFKFSNRPVGILPSLGSPTLFLPDNNYVSKINYNYDTEGNVLNVKKENDINTSYIWAYNNKYPVVKIEGIAEGDISSSIKTNISARTFTISTNSADVKTDVDYLKAQLSSLMSDPRYMVTIYTYSPLIGMTSQTDPNGVTTYYEYDSFGRMKTTLDNESKVTKHYKYHYAGEPAPPSGATLTLSTSNQSFGVYGGSITVSVTSNTSWSVSGAPWWLSVSPSSGTGSGSFTITALENTGPLRTANIIVTANEIDRSIVIEQDPFVAPPNFDLYSLPWTAPSHLTGQEYNPLVYDPSEISLWYNFGWYDTNNYEYIQLETTGDPNPVSVDAVYYNNMGWIDFYYDDVNNRLVFCITNLAPPTDWAIIGVTSRGLTKRISVSVRE